MAQAQQALASGDIEVEEENEEMVTEQVVEAYSADESSTDAGQAQEPDEANYRSSTVLHNVITWLEMLDDSERTRVMRAATVFFTAVIRCPGL